MIRRFRMEKKSVWHAWLDTHIGSVLNVALYIAASSAAAGLIDWIAKMDLSDKPVWAVALVGAVNLILVAIRELLIAQRNKKQ
jgi:hypothetical protein